MSGVWRLEQVDGLTIVRCTTLPDGTGLAHAFSTRRADGREDFDLGGALDRDPELDRRRARFLRAAGIGGTRPFLLRQVHGARVVTCLDAREVPPEADAALWLRRASSDCVPSVRTADCVPILLVDRAGRGAAAVHAGWRGTAAAVAGRAVGTLGRAGIPPEDLLAAIGPAIGPCCYEVGPEVAHAVASASGAVLGSAQPGGKVHLDLPLENRAQLTAAGVLEERIETAPWCTFCRGDLFFSYRRDGSVAGRMMASIGPTP